MKSWFWQKNKMTPCSGVPLNDRGFRYGQHLFETIAIRNGKVLFFEEHWMRLIAAAERHRFPVDAFWHQGVHDFLKRESWEDGVLRIFLTAGEGLPLSPITKPQLFLFWEEADFPSEEKFKKGIKVVSLDQPIGTISWGEKTGNYWEHLNALESARQAGAEEGLVFDREDFLISAAMANVILWLEDGGIVTPPRSRGARDGVMLDQVRQCFPKLMETDMRRDDLKKVVAMVVTNSRLGVMPVAMLDGRKLSHLSFPIIF
ncbi:MAG: aminotransferase class IV [Chthoniobacterales bacterium]|nr:aminotransferase class IV [Chthoniobacterales bacterium]